MSIDVSLPRLQAAHLLAELGLCWIIRLCTQFINYGASVQSGKEICFVKTTNKLKNVMFVMLT